MSLRDGLTKVAGHPRGQTAALRRRPGASSAAEPMPLPFARLEPAKGATSNAYMSARPCPTCGGERNRLLFAYDNYQFYTDADVPKQAAIRQVYCLDCFGVFMNPVFTPEGFGALFAEAGASYGSTSNRQEEQIAWLTDHHLLAPGGTLLDIGCYDGSFIGKLPEGVNGVGVDIDGPAVARAQERFGAGTRHRFICSDFEEFDIDAPSDVIVMFHVLEHLPRPVAVLQRLAKLSTAKTRLVVEVPVFEDIIRLAFGDVSGFLTVQHLTHFSIASLHNVLRRAGWNPIQSVSMEDYVGFRVVAEPASRLDFRPERADHSLVMNYMSGWYATISDVEARIQKLHAPHCILRGGGLQTEYLYQLTSMFAGERDFVIIDKDPLKQGKNWRGIPILGPEHLAKADWNNTQMVLSSYSHQAAMVEEARAGGIPEAAVVSIYDKVRRY